MQAFERKKASPRYERAGLFYAVLERIPCGGLDVVGGKELSGCRANQAGEFLIRLVTGHEFRHLPALSLGGVKIDFAHAGRELWDEAVDAFGGHMARPAQTEAGIIRLHASGANLGPKNTGPLFQSTIPERGNAAQRGGGLHRGADCLQAVCLARMDHHMPDGWVQMHVLMGVGMVQP